MLGLGFLCAFFPQDGIQIGSIHLRFPDLAYALDAEQKDEVIDTIPLDTIPEDTVEVKGPDEQLQVLMEAKEDEFMNFCDKSPTRIYLPHDSLEYLDNFFISLENAEKRRIRIMHYGDSQLEGDRMTCYLRQNFQDTFGGNGLGLVPVIQTVSSATLKEDCTGDIQRYLGYGPKSEQAEHHRYGPLCQMAEVDGEAKIEFTCTGGKRFSHSGHFSQVKILASGHGTMDLYVGNDTISSVRELESETMQMVSFPVGGYKGVLNITGQVEIYGMMLDGGAGVQMDNIGLRGSAGTIFTGIDRSTLAPFFSQEKVSLIILQFGGNSVPYLEAQSNVNGYVNSLRSQIRMFKRLSPQSCILFVGPSDMATQEGEEMVTYPILPSLVSSLRKMCDEEGIAFWNMFAAQGGRGSMVKWVELGLAGEDYVHFSPSGARKISKILFETLQMYYRFFRFRTGRDKIELPDDSLLVDSIKKDSLAKDNSKKRPAHKDSIKAQMAIKDSITGTKKNVEAQTETEVPQ